MYYVKKFFEAANLAVAVNRKIIDIAQRNLNSGLDLAKSLAGAKDPSEFVELQTRYWLKQLGELAAQAEEVSSRLFGKSLLPLQQGSSPATHDPTSARLEQEYSGQRTPPPHAAQTKVRPLDERRGTAEKRSTRLRRAGSTAHSLATKQVEGKTQPKRGASKARLSPGSVAKSGARSASEGQLTTQKKGARQALSNDIKFGMLDGNAVRFTDFEAWWLVDGAWCPISCREVLANAAVMREERFKQLFPKVPRLPRSAFKSDHGSTSSKTPFGID